MGAEIGGADKAKSEPNVVPLCDILLVLLIIFMVVTPMVRRGANVKLPEASNVQSQPKPGEMITVDLKKDGTVYINDDIVEDLTKLAVLIEEILEEREQKEKNKVLLKADTEITYGKVVDVMDQIRNANIEIIGLVTIRKATAE